MALTVYTNIYSAVSQRNLDIANSALSRSIERLSSGLRINHAADDASGLAISEKLRGQIRGLTKASMNAQDATSFLQTAEGGMEVMGDMLQRLRELAVQAGNGTYTANDRKELQKEVDQLKNEIDRVSASTEFNTKKMLTGLGSGLWSSNKSNVDVVFRGAPAEGNYKLSFDIAPGKNAIYKSTIMAVSRDLVVERVGANATSMRNFSAVGDIEAFGGASIDFKAASAITANAAQIASYKNANSTYAGAASMTLVAAGARAGYVEVEILTNVVDMSATGGSPSNAKFVFVDAITGGMVEKIVTLEDLAGGSATNVVFDNGVNITFSMAVGGATDTMTAGDKYLFRTQPAVTAGNFDATKDAKVTITMKNDAGGTVLGPEVIIPNGQNQGGTLAGVTIKDGKFMEGTVSWDRDYSFTTFVPGKVELAAFKQGDVAASNIKLKDIAAFTNADGRMILDNTQSLTIYGNYEQSALTLEGDDTLEDFANKLRKVIAEDLGMTDTGIGLYDLVKFVTAASTMGGNYGVPGTFVVQSAKSGTQSELKFLGDEALLSALGLTSIQKPVNGEVTVAVTDAHSGKFIGQDTVSDYMLRGIIGGVDVKIDSNIGVSAAFDAATGRMIFTPKPEDDVYLHIVSRATEIQVGASEGQTMDVSIGRLDTISLEIADAFIMTMEDAQKAITKFDRALEIVTSNRATIGAQINRLEYTQKNLSVTKQNLIASESRIRDLDIADESALFTRNQILMNSAIAMLAQANQMPQMALQLIGR